MIIVNIAITVPIRPRTGAMAIKSISNLTMANQENTIANQTVANLPGKSFANGRGLFAIRRTYIARNSGSFSAPKQIVNILQRDLQGRIVLTPI